MWVFENIDSKKKLFVQEIYIQEGKKKALELIRNFNFSHPNLLGIQRCIELNGAEMN